MKKFSFIMLLSFSVLFLFSCKDNETGPDDTSTDGYKINVYTASDSTDNSEIVELENDTMSVFKRASIGVTCPEVLDDCALVCRIYEYDINGNKVLLYEDSVYVPRELAISEFCCFTSYHPYSEGDRIIEVTKTDTKEIKLSRVIHFIEEW